MATMDQYTTRRQRVSNLDVLWAFYLSQPKQVRKAFRDRLESEGKVPNPMQWEKDLKDIRGLKENWDEEGAPRINRVAIANVQDFVSALDRVIAEQVRLYPTHIGGIMLKFETERGRIKCEIGDKLFSYFVKRPDASTEHYSFEEINKDTLSVLKSKIANVA